MVRVAVIAVLLLAVAAAPARAAIVEDLKPCYVSAGETDAERETIVIAGEQFTQESVVEVLFDGVVMGSALTGSIGEFELRLPAPFQLAGQRPLTVTVRDAVQQIVKTTRVTDLAMTVKPRNATPTERVRLRGRGFTLGQPVFAHYVFRGELQKTVRLARRATGPCGSFDLRRRLMPIDNPRSGRWIMQVDQRREYSPQPNPVWVRRAITVSFGS